MPRGPKGEKRTADVIGNAVHAKPKRAKGGQQDSIGDKERLQVLLAEYTSLRTEANARMSSVFQVASLAALVIIWLLQQRDVNPQLYIGLVAAILGLFVCAWTIARDLVRVALRLKQIEADVNRRADEHLLVWETEWGGQTSPIWSSRLARRLLLLNRPPFNGKEVEVSN